MDVRRLVSRHAVVSACFLLLYLLLNRPEVILLSRIGFVAWYPASGLIIAMLLGISPWYAVLVCLADPIAGKLIYAQPIISYSYTVDAVAIGVCYGTAAYVLRSILKIDLELRHRRDVVLYVTVTSTAAVIAALIGTACLVADHSISWAEYKPSTIGWFLGDAIGLLGIAPFLLVYVVPLVRRWLGNSRVEVQQRRDEKQVFDAAGLWEALGQALVMLAVLWVIFPSRWGHYEHFYLAFIPVIWMALRPGIRRVVVGLLGFNFGIVVAMHACPPTTILFTKVASLMLILSCVGLLVGTEVSERQHIATELNERTTYLNSLIEKSPLAIVVLDREGHVELANPAFNKLFLYDGSEISSGDDPSGSNELIPQVFAGHAQHTTVRQQRKDGRTLDLSLDAVPLVLNGQVRGAYLIYQDISEQIRASEAQRQHAESLDKLVQKLKRHTEQMTVLNRMGDLLECSATVKEACAVVSHSIEQLFPEASSGTLYLFRSSRNSLEAAVHWGDTTISEPLFVPEACWSLRRGQFHWSEQSGAAISCQHLRQGTAACSLCVPMVAQGNTLGILHLEFDRGVMQEREPDTESPQEAREQLAVRVAGQLGLSLASLQLRETLREQSIRDPLTGLYNRRFMEETLERELHRAARANECVSVLMLDLDHFKRFNDSFGHDAGDFVLRSISDLFVSYFRATDICCRYGGEEFAIVMPAAPADQAVARAEALREKLKSLELRHEKRHLGSLTVSIGIAAFPEHGRTAGELLKTADRCLYHSKKTGRDRVTAPAFAQNA